jgi:hypothetical protein
MGMPPGMPGQPPPGQPPFGSSPATGPTQNLGSTASGMARISLILQLMEQTLPLVGATSEPGQDLLKSMQMLGKHIQPGSVSPAAEQNALASAQLKQAQMAPQIAALRARAAQAAAAPGAVSAMPPPAAATAAGPNPTPT